MRGGSKNSSAARPPTDRRHWRWKGEREAIGDRPSTRLGTAVKPATLHGQSVAGYRRDRRGFQRARHSYLVTSASRNPRLSRLRLSSSPRRSPALRRPDGLSDRRAERHHRQKRWTSEVLNSVSPCRDTTHQFAYVVGSHTALDICWSAYRRHTAIRGFTAHAIGLLECH